MLIHTLYRQEAAMCYVMSGYLRRCKTERTLACIVTTNDPIEIITTTLVNTPRDWEAGAWQNVWYVAMRETRTHIDTEQYTQHET